MAEGVLGLGQGSAAGLNQELIDRLKAAEKKATVDPLEKDLETIDKETEKIQEIITKANEFLETIKPFDLYVKGGETAFDEKAATTSGTSASFASIDSSKLSVGTINVDITTMAQNDVYQSRVITQAQYDAPINAGTLTIATADGDSYDFDTADLTYEQLADQISLRSKLNASVEQVGDGEYRLVVKSSDTGTSNGISFTGDAGSAAVELGFRSEVSPGIFDNDPDAHTQMASNMKATVNGIDYNVEGNAIIVDGGLKITAVEVGISSITIAKSTEEIRPKIEAMIEKFNELTNMVNEELDNIDSPIENKSDLRTMMGTIKNTLFANYGTAEDKNLFAFGIEVDARAGTLSIGDEDKFNESITNDLDSLRTLFVGVAEKEGIGTKLKTYVDGLDSYKTGLLSNYQDSILNAEDGRKKSLEDEKTKAEEDLDAKYKQMAQQFAAYGVIINQMEASFSGLKLMIQQSTAQG